MFCDKLLVLNDFVVCLFSCDYECLVFYIKIFNVEIILILCDYVSECYYVFNGFIYIWYDLDDVFLVGKFIVFIGENYVKVVLDWCVLFVLEVDGVCYFFIFLGLMIGCGFDVDICINDLGIFCFYVCINVWF